MVLKSTSSGTQKYQQWNSLKTRHLSVPSPQCLFVPSAKFPPFVSLKILRKYANLTHNLTHHKHLIISCKDTKCVRFGDFLLNFITRYCTRASFITFIARGRQNTTGGDEEGEEWGLGLQQALILNSKSLRHLLRHGCPCPTLNSSCKGSHCRVSMTTSWRRSAESGSTRLEPWKRLWHCGNFNFRMFIRTTRSSSARLTLQE